MLIIGLLAYDTNFYLKTVFKYLSPKLESSFEVKMQHNELVRSESIHKNVGVSDISIKLDYKFYNILHHARKSLKLWKI